MKPCGKTYARCGFITKNVEGGAEAAPPPPPGLIRVKAAMFFGSPEHLTF